MLAELLDDLLLVISTPPQGIYEAILGHTLTGIPKAVQRAVTLHTRTFYGADEPGERAARLQLAARKAGEHTLADRISGLPVRLPWSVPWAHWRTNVEPDWLSSASVEYVRAVRTVHTDEGDIVVCALGSHVWSQLREHELHYFDFEVDFDIADVATWNDSVYIAAALVAVAVDIRAMRAGGYSVGLRRQTAKGLAHDGSRPWWVTPLFWGLDTGLVWSTFRVSATSWVMLLSAFWTVAPQWSGLVYGTFFGIPLIAAVCTGDPEKFGRPGSSPPTRLVQGLGAALMAVLPVAMVVISIAPA